MLYQLQSAVTHKLAGACQDGQHLPPSAGAELRSESIAMQIMSDRLEPAFWPLQFGAVFTTALCSHLPCFVTLRTLENTEPRDQPSVSSLLG